MFDDDINYDDVFGLTADDTANGEKGADTADQPSDEETSGAKESEAAEQTQDESEDSGETADMDEPEADAGRKPQSKEENARYAAARRKADAEVEKRVKDALDSRFARMGMTDPYTQKTITTAEEFDSYLNRLEDERRENVAKKAGMSKEELDEFINNQPEVKAAREAQAQAQEARIQAQIAEELRQISALDPSIHTVADVLNSENGEQIKALISQNRTMLEAFKLANFDRLRGESGEDERRHAELNAASKSHLTQSKTRGQGMASVPKETLHWYKIFNPDMTEAEIQRDYNKQLKNTGG